MSRPLADESVYRAVAHPARRRMLDLLRTRERPVSEIRDAFHMKAQTLSHHLRILRTTGLIQQRRNGRQRVYFIDPAQLRDIHHWTALFQPLWTARRAKS